MKKNRDYFVKVKKLVNAIFVSSYLVLFTWGIIELFKIGDEAGLFITLFMILDVATFWVLIRILKGEKTPGTLWFVAVGVMAIPFVGNAILTAMGYAVNPVEQYKVMLPYAATTFLGCVAFWQNDRLSKINEEMREKEDLRERALPYIEYLMVHRECAHFAIGNLGKMAIHFKCWLMEDSHSIKIIMSGDVKIDCIEKDFFMRTGEEQPRLVFRIDRKEGDEGKEILVCFSFENIRGDCFKGELALKNLVEREKKLLRGTKVARP